MKIDVDFDVFKALTLRRSTEDMSCNDVLRELLELGPQESPVPSQPTAGDGEWVAKGVHFPSGTEFRATYKGQMYSGRVESGALVVDNRPFGSPSAAAVSITGKPWNGWHFWECRLPGKDSWQTINSLREQRPAVVTIEGLTAVSPSEEEVSPEKSHPKPEWDLEFHFGNKPAPIRALFDEIRESVLALSEADDGIRQSIGKVYIAYKTSRNFCEIIPQRKRLRIHLDIPATQLDDPRGIVEDWFGRDHNATGDTRFDLSPDDDLDYALSLIRQSYERTL